MPGGLLNLVAYGSENIIVNENPSKTFFKSVYKKYTNFGMQTFRIDYSGTNDLQEFTKSTFKFKIKRYGDLLHDTYLSITLPDIYGCGLKDDDDTYKYNFKWIKHLGYNMIDEISIVIGGQLINKYSGEYLLMLQQQFQSEDKISHLNEMTGNTPDLNDPEKYIKEYYNYNPSYDSFNKTDFYPASYKNTDNEPSIKGKKLYIPINAWFGNSMKQSLPLVSLQYHEVDIIVTLKAIKDLYIVQNKHFIKKNDDDDDKFVFCNKTGDIINKTLKEQFDLSLGNIQKTNQQIFTTKTEKNDDVTSIYNYLSPENNNNDISFEMFLKNNFSNWNPDIHLISTYVFLTEEERSIFARDEQSYLVKICHEEEYLGLLGNQSVSINVHSLVTDIFWRFRRSDSNKRNEWSNYTNIKYNEELNYIPVFNNNIFNTQTIGQNEETNDISILKTLSIMFDGKIREESFSKDIYKSLQKYRTKNTFTRELKELYYYSFGLEEGLEDLQPSGAINTNKYKNVRFIFDTINTPNNPNVDTNTLVKYVRNDTTVPFRVLTDNKETNNLAIISNDTDGTCVPVFDKTFRQEKLYTFDLKICTRKYNLLIINSGMGGLKYAR